MAWIATFIDFVHSHNIPCLFLSVIFETLIQFALYHRPSSSSGRYSFYVHKKKKKTFTASIVDRCMKFPRYNFSCIYIYRLRHEFYVYEFPQVTYCFLSGFPKFGTKILRSQHIVLYYNDEIITIWDFHLKIFFSPASTIFFFQSQHIITCRTELLK